MTQSSEERNFFERAYKGAPPWDVHAPQPEFVLIATGGEIKGSVLDVGCGTGENALYLAARGHEVWGVDSAATAIKRARTKAAQRNLDVTFKEGDALRLSHLGRTFDTVIDSGLFHTLSDEERAEYVKGLKAVLPPGGTFFMLCFSNREPDWGGPRRVSQDEILAAFGQGWRINYIREAVFMGNLHQGKARAWLCSITRIDELHRH